MPDGSTEFRFRKHDTLGVAAAEEDRDFLDSCFVDVGYLPILRDTKDARRIVLGRTGSGKTALLRKLSAREANAITILPETCALQYISNSNVLMAIAELGVPLDIFFKLLWRHVFSVEIIKRHFRVYDEESKRGFLDRIKSLFADKRHKAAIEYLENWGRSFWQETDYRVKEVTTKLENEVEASVGPELAGLAFKVGGTRKLSEEQKAEIVNRASKVINSVQIRELSQILKMLDELIEDPQKPTFYSSISSTRSGRRTASDTGSSAR